MSHKEYEPQLTGGFYEEFINSPVIDPAVVEYLLTDPPFLQELEDKKISEVLKTVGEANRTSPLLIENLMNPILKTSTEEYGNRDDLFQATQYFLYPQLAEEVATRILRSKSLPVMVASAHFGAREMAKLHQSESEGENEKTLGYARYFGAVQTLLLGCKSSTTVMALNPEMVESSNSKIIAPLVTIDDKDDLQSQRLRYLFEGYKVSDISELENGQIYFSLLEKAT